MERMGTINRNILAKFVNVANEMGWPVYVPNHKLLERDGLFPRIKYLAKEGLDTFDQYYTLEKLNGKWQVQKVTRKGIVPVTGWTSTRPLSVGMELTLDLLEEKRDQGLA